jgi:hypothetical protein
MLPLLPVAVLYKDYLKSLYELEYGSAFCFNGKIDIQSGS